MDRLPSWVEIDLDALEWNIGRIRSLLPAHVRMLLVVKADAYGHGAVRIARQAAECGVDMLGVATLDEGKELREAGIALPVLILSPVLPEELDEVLAYDLAVSVSSLDFAAAASEASRRSGYPCIVHVEIDTGMGRAGFPADGAVESIVRMASLQGLRLEGIFTHFPSSDSDNEFTEEQIRDFTAVVDG
jgi:alanine racemase